MRTILLILALFAVTSFAANMCYCPCPDDDSGDTISFGVGDGTGNVISNGGSIDAGNGDSGRNSGRNSGRGSGKGGRGSNNNNNNNNNSNNSNNQGDNTDDEPTVDPVVTEDPVESEDPVDTNENSSSNNNNNNNNNSNNNNNNNNNNNSNNGDDGNVVEAGWNGAGNSGSANSNSGTKGNSNSGSTNSNSGTKGNSGSTSNSGSTNTNSGSTNSNSGSTSSNSGSSSSSSGSSGSFASVCLDAHNKERSSLGIVSLVWDSSLASAAQTWANTIANNGALEHSDNRVHVGENTARRTYKSGVDSAALLNGQWLDEKQYFKKGNYPNISNSGNVHDVGHYSQMIWAKTTKLGCGIARAGKYDYLVCQYAESGNRSGNPVY